MLSELDLSRNGLSAGSPMIDDLVALLRTNRFFRKLNLSRNNLDFLELSQKRPDILRKDISHLGQGLTLHGSLTILDLSNNELWKLKNQVEVLARGLGANRSIRTLKLNKNGLGFLEEHVQFLAQAFCANDTLTTVEMMDNDLYRHSSTLEHLAAIFRHNRSLTEVNLGYNRIHYSSEQGFRNCLRPFESFAKAFKSFSEALGVNSFITALNLSGHELGWLQKGEGEVIQSLAKALAQNRTLVSLRFGENRLGFLERKVMQNLVKSFCQNQGIRELVLKENSLTASCMIPFFRTTRRNKKLAYNAVRICTLIAFVRANRRNRLVTSVLPLIPSVIKLVGINNA